MTAPTEPGYFHARQEQRARERHGWVPATGVMCPRVLAGLRCQFDAQPEPERCICNQSIADHPRRWRDKNGAAVVTYEPYPAGGGTLAAFLTHLDDLGLYVTVSPDSIWNPGGCLLLIVRTTP